MSDQFFSVEGFYEDFSTVDTAKYLGKLVVEWPDRLMGSAGTIDRTLTETIVLKRNMKDVAYKASKTAPLIVRCTLYPLCGRTLKIGDKVKVRRSAQDHARSVAPKTGEIIKFDTGVPGLIELRNGVIHWTEEYWRIQLL